MKTEELSAVIESIMFVAGEAVEIDVIKEKLEVGAPAIKKAIEELKAKYNEKSGINIIEFKNKIQLTSNPKLAEKIETVLNPIKEKLLSRATLETLSIIAYKQPVTRLEVEEIRGANSDYAIDLLSKNNLIEVVGRKDTIGKPLLFATTEDFLKRFEISDLNCLPKYEDILNRIKTIRETQTEDVAKTLYNEFEIEEEKEVQDQAN